MPFQLFQCFSTDSLWVIVSHFVLIQPLNKALHCHHYYLEKYFATKSWRARSLRTWGRSLYSTRWDDFSGERIPEKVAHGYCWVHGRCLLFFNLFGPPSAYALVIISRSSPPVMNSIPLPISKSMLSTYGLVGTITIMCLSTDTQNSSCIDKEGRSYPPHKDKQE